MSEEITGLQTPYEYVLLGFVIHSHNHTKSIDVKNNIIMFEIFEFQQKEMIFVTQVQNRHFRKQ